MAYNFLAESSESLDWARLVSRLSAVGAGMVEAFPIPAEDVEEKNAVGVSLPRKSADEEGSRHLEATLRMLMTEFLMEITDLHAGHRISTKDLADIRALATDAY